MLACKGNHLHSRDRALGFPTPQRNPHTRSPIRQRNPSTRICSTFAAEGTVQRTSKLDFHPSLLAPWFFRKTTFTSFGDRFHIVEQPSGIGEVNLHSRCFIYKLRSGALLVYATVAPTASCVEFIKDLGHPVKYIVVPNNQLEHYVTAPEFAAVFPEACVCIPKAVLRSDVGIVPQQTLFKDDVMQKLAKHKTVVLLTDNNVPSEWAKELRVATLSTNSLVELSILVKDMRILLSPEMCTFLTASETDLRLFSEDAYSTKGKNPIGVWLFDLFLPAFAGKVSDTAFVAMYSRLSAEHSPNFVEEFARWYRVLMDWDFDGAVRFHGDPAYVTDAKQLLKNTWGKCLASAERTQAV